MKRREFIDKANIKYYWQDLFYRLYTGKITVEKFTEETARLEKKVGTPSLGLLS